MSRHYDTFQASRRCLAIDHRHHDIFLDRNISPCLPVPVEAVFSALGEPGRLRIVELLRLGPHAVGDIVERLGMRQPQVSKHLKVLAQAGLVRVQPRARHRIYHLDADAFEQMREWVDSFEELWAARLDSLGRYLEELDEEERDQ